MHSDALIAVVLVGAVATRAQAQPFAGRGHNAPQFTTFDLMLVGSVGSAPDLQVGLLAGAGLGIGGGDDPGLGGAILGAAMGSAAGTALGVHFASGGRVPAGSALSAGVLGIMAGIGTAALLGKLSNGTMDATGAFISFSIGQGVSAGALAKGLQRR